LTGFTQLPTKKPALKKSEAKEAQRKGKKPRLRQ
jgi:hypothetical protein